MDTISIAIAGFSAVGAVLLFLVYVFLIDVQGKSAYSVISCAVLLTALAGIQVFHLLHFGGGPPPLERFPYRLALFAVPSAFYLFKRWAIQPAEPFRPILQLHLLPILLLFFVRLQIALPILLLFGVGYSLWLGHFIYGLRAQRRQFRFEFFYFGVMSVSAVFVLILGLSIPYIDDALFYHFYSWAIGLGFAIVIVALISNPDLIGDLSEAARVRVWDLDPARGRCGCLPEEAS